MVRDQLQCEPYGLCVAQATHPVAPRDVRRVRAAPITRQSRVCQRLGKICLGLREPQKFCIQSLRRQRAQRLKLTEIFARQELRLDQRAAHAKTHAVSSKRPPRYQAGLTQLRLIHDQLAGVQRQQVVASRRRQQGVTAAKQLGCGLHQRVVSAKLSHVQQFCFQVVAGSTHAAAQGSSEIPLECDQLSLGGFALIGIGGFELREGHTRPIRVLSHQHGRHNARANKQHNAQKRIS